MMTETVLYNDIVGKSSMPAGEWTLTMQKVVFSALGTTGFLTGHFCKKPCARWLFYYSILAQISFLLLFYLTIASIGP